MKRRIRMRQIVNRVIYRMAFIGFISGGVFLGMMIGTGIMIGNYIGSLTWVAGAASAIVSLVIYGRDKERMGNARHN